MRTSTTGSACYASILIIGDEILGGFTTDSNVERIAHRMRAFGVELDHAGFVKDDAADISDAVVGEMRRPRPRLCVTTGGVGPTPDDVTYEAVAAALGVELVSARRIERWIENWMQDVPESLPIHESMQRMAQIPEGSRLLAPDAVDGPAVALDIDGGISHQQGATIVMLPGAPSYVELLMSQAVEPELLASMQPHPLSAVEIHHRLEEAALGPCFEQLQRRFPEVRVGSYSGDPMLLRIQGPTPDIQDASRLAERIIRLLESKRDSASDQGGKRHRLRQCVRL